MDFDVIKEHLAAFDPSKLLPNLEPLMEKMQLYVVTLVLIAPLVLLVLGLIYFFLPPREANHSFGYQFFWGKSSVECWRFTQWVAGMVFGLLGIILTVSMLIISRGFQSLDTADMVQQVGTCIVWELILVAVACIVIDLIVLIRYNSKGFRRHLSRRSQEPARER